MGFSKARVDELEDLIKRQKGAKMIVAGSSNNKYVNSIIYKCNNCSKELAFDVRTRRCIDSHRLKCQICDNEERYVILNINEN